MLILVLIEIQYLQNVVLSFEKGLSDQNHFLPDSHYLINTSPGKFSIPLPLETIRETMDK